MNITHKQVRRVLHTFGVTALAGTLTLLATTSSGQPGDEVQPSGGPPPRALIDSGGEGAQARRQEGGKPDRAPPGSQSMRASEAISEKDSTPAAEIDAEAAREINAKRNLPDMAAELKEHESRGSPAQRGDLPSVEETRREAQSIEARNERPRPNREGFDQEERERKADHATRAQGASHLKLVLRLKADGSTEVLSATEFAEGAILSNEATSDFIYEVRKGGRGVSAEALTVDPFEVHSFGGPADEQGGHFVSSQSDATIVVSAPNLTLATAGDDLEVNLYQLEPGPEVLKVDLATVEQLKRERRVKRVRQASGRQLAPGIQARGQKRGPDR